MKAGWSENEKLVLTDKSGLLGGANLGQEAGRAGAELCTDIILIAWCCYKCYKEGKKERIREEFESHIEALRAGGHRIYEEPFDEFRRENPDLERLNALEAAKIFIEDKKLRMNAIHNMMSEEIAIMRDGGPEAWKRHRKRQAALHEMPRLRYSDPGASTSAAGQEVRAERLEELAEGTSDRPSRLIIYPIDESERPFSAEERRVAEKLQSEGRKVKALLEGKKKGQRCPDALVDGVPTEFKTSIPKPGEVTDSETIRNVVNNSIRREGQARHIIIDARGTDLTKEEADRGLRRAAGIARGKLDYVRIIGDGYDIPFTDFKK